VSLRNISLAFLFTCLTIPALAQGTAASGTPAAHHGLGMMRMWGMASDQEIDQSLDTLQRTLNLNSSQVTSIRQLAQSRRESLRSIREQARPKFQQLMTLLHQPNPDATAVGRVVIELKTVHEQARAKQNEYEKQLTSLLNPTQQQIVNNLRNQAQTYRALRSIGLLGAPEFPHGMFMSGGHPSAKRGGDVDY
jgi:Spy/CpxP family protein refolding chaperone